MTFYATCTCRNVLEETRFCGLAGISVPVNNYNFKYTSVLASPIICRFKTTFNADYETACRIPAGTNTVYPCHLLPERVDGVKGVCSGEVLPVTTTAHPYGVTLTIAFYDRYDVMYLYLAPGILDLLIILDASDATTASDWALSIEFTQLLVHALNFTEDQVTFNYHIRFLLCSFWHHTVRLSQIRISLVAATNESHLLISFNDNIGKNAIVSALGNATYLGGVPNFASALRVAKGQAFTVANGDRSNTPNAVLMVMSSWVVADFTSQNSNIYVELVQMRLFSQGSTTIGIGSIDDVNLRSISYPTNRFRRYDSYQTLVTKAAEVANVVMGNNL